jgi:hypothetical protein
MPGASLRPHIILLLFVAGKDADLANVGFEKPAQHGIAEAAGAAGDEQGFVFKHIKAERGQRAGRKRTNQMLKS